MTHVSPSRVGVQGAGPARPLRSSPLSLQSFDESGRRTAGPGAMPSTIGFCLFSSLDDGMGYGCVEGILDCWHQEGVENSQDVLKVTAGPASAPLALLCGVLGYSWVFPC